MSDLRMDMDALGRLSPQVQSVADRLMKNHDSSDLLRGLKLGDGAGTPSLQAAQTVTTDVVPGIEHKVASRFIVVADLVTEAARRIKTIDEAGLQALVSAAPTLLPPPPRG